jgi:hypothetical protein
MQYFNKLPKIVEYDAKGIGRVFTNLITRASVIPEFLKNPMVYYQYTMQEGDTPEIIAAKYYGDSYRYWIVLFANELLDPQWDWPMSNKVFEEYITTKYPNIQTTVEVHHREKILTQYDSGTNTETVNRVKISEFDYNQLVESNYYKTLPYSELEPALVQYDHQFPWYKNQFSSAYYLASGEVPDYCQRQYLSSEREIHSSAHLFLHIH